jgi:hypothetical protein
MAATAAAAAAAACAGPQVTGSSGSGRDTAGKHRAACMCPQQQLAVQWWRSSSSSSTSSSMWSCGVRKPSPQQRQLAVQCRGGCGGSTNSCTCSYGLHKPAVAASSAAAGQPCCGQHQLPRVPTSGVSLVHGPNCIIASFTCPWGYQRASPPEAGTCLFSYKVCWGLHAVFRTQQGTSAFDPTQEAA